MFLTKNLLYSINKDWSIPTPQLPSTVEWAAIDCCTYKNNTYLTALSSSGSCYYYQFETGKWQSSINSLPNLGWVDMISNTSTGVVEAISTNGYTAEKQIIGSWGSYWRPSYITNQTWQAVIPSGNQFLIFSQNAYYSTGAGGSYANPTSYFTQSINDWRDTDNGVSISASGYISILRDSWLEQITTLGNNDWKRIINYSSNKYAALSTTGYVSFSNGGRIWSNAEQPEQLKNHEWQSMCFTGKKLIILAKDGYISQKLI